MYSRFLRARCPAAIPRPRLSALIAVVLVAALYGPAQAAVITAAVPRTTDGKPDLQGIWQARGTAADDLQRHGASRGVKAGKSVVEGGAIPYR
jgi:hypothetical protein